MRPSVATLNFVCRRRATPQRFPANQFTGTMAIRAGVVQWQYRSFPSFGRGFDSHRPLQILKRLPRSATLRFFQYSKLITRRAVPKVWLSVREMSRAGRSNTDARRRRRKGCGLPRIVRLAERLRFGHRRSSRRPRRCRRVAATMREVFSKQSPWKDVVSSFETLKEPRGNRRVLRWLA
jgi:hypothetical protein